MFGKKLTASGRLAVGLALAGASLALAVAAARADPYSPYGGTTASSVEGVTVYSPYRYVRQPTTGQMVRMNQVSMTVPLGDLDLSTGYGARLAKARIVRAARDVCQRVEAIYPGSGEPPAVATPWPCATPCARRRLRQATRSSPGATASAADAR